MATEYSRIAPIDPRRKACAAQPSPWFVHPFEEHARGAMRALRHYSRAATDGQRAELLVDVCWKLYGDYFRRTSEPKMPMPGQKTKWVCPALVQPEDDDDDASLSAYNASAWVEADAPALMIAYLESGDFFRMCHDASREIQLECASLRWREAADELQFASNILTAYNDVAATDYNLRHAIRAHLDTRDLRWEQNRPEIPDTPPDTRRPRSYSPTTAGDDWENDYIILESPMSKISVHTEVKAPRPSDLRRSISTPF
tara:strand:+ start:291 stop:1061 length:771 start_codon:yes stop_codon:yes gene_type:complete